MRPGDWVRIRIECLTSFKFRVSSVRESRVSFSLAQGCLCASYMEVGEHALAKTTRIMIDSTVGFCLGIWFEFRVLS